MEQKTLAELNGVRINNPMTPEDIAKSALESYNSTDLMGVVKQMFALSPKDHENESNIAKGTPFNADTLYSEFAQMTNFTTESDEFVSLAGDMLHDAHISAEHNEDVAIAARAAEIGRSLSRLYSEKTLADKIGGKVAEVKFESDSIDILTSDGKTVQVFTCFPQSDNTSGKPAKNKMDDEAMEKVDRYVVLHANDDGTFGVGVNNLNNGQETDGKHENTVAKNA